MINNTLNMFIKQDNVLLCLIYQIKSFSTHFFSFVISFFLIFAQCQ